MKKIILSFLVFTAMNGTAQNSLFNFQLSGGVNATKIFTSKKPSVPEFDQWDVIRIGWSIRPEVRYQISKIVGINSGFQFGTYSYGENNETDFRFGTDNFEQQTYVGSRIRHYSIGVPIYLDIKTGSRVSFQAGLNYQHNFRGKVNAYLYEAGIRNTNFRLAEDEYNPVVQENFSANLGIRLYPKGNDDLTKKIFLALSTEYFFRPDVLYFSEYNANKATIHLLIGYHF